MFRSPLVSVIIPAYNAATFISQTLDSVLSQTYRNIEVIVVDDGSQDQTPQIVKSTAENDARVMLLQQSNRGVAAARNLAIKNARGEYIAPIDGDDIWHPQKIEKQVWCMQQAGPSVGLVYAWWIGIDEQGMPMYTYPTWNVEGMVHEALIYINFIGNASVPLIRRSCIEHVGGYRSQWREQGGQGCEDWDLSLRIAEHYQFRVVPAYLVGYRRVMNSISGDCISMAKSYELMIEEIKQRHPEIPDEIYHWSKSHFYLYLADISGKGGNYQSTLRWVYKSWCLDHVVIWSPWSAKLIVKSLLGIAAKPVVSLLRRNDDAWMNFKQCSSFGNRENNIFSELEGKSKIKPFLWNPWYPYDRICIQRWRQITESFIQRH